MPNRALLAAALANESRWTILKELSKGEPRMTLELARLVGNSPDATAKQMFMLKPPELRCNRTDGFTPFPNNICRNPASRLWTSAIACSG